MNISGKQLIVLYWANLVHPVIINRSPPHEGKTNNVKVKWFVLRKARD